MANRWKGNFVVAANVTSSGTAYNGRADGAWNLNNQLQQKQGSLWSIGIGPPTPPISISASASNAQATVSFTPQATGGGTVTYTVTSTPGNITATGSASPITVTGLTNGTSYTFKVKGTNTFGYTSADSAASNAVTPVATLLALTTGTTPFINLYNFTVASGFGTKISTSAIAGFGGPISFNSTGSYVTSAQGQRGGGDNWVIAACGGAGIGTQVSLPALAAGTPYGTAFSPDNSTFVVNNSGTPYIYAFPWTGSSLGTKYADPSVLPSLTYSGRQLIFSPSGTVVIEAGGASPYVNAYTWNSGWGTKYADPVTLPTATCTVLAFKGNNIVLGQNSTNSYAAYPWNNGFGTKFAAPSSPPPQVGVQAINFNSNGTVLISAHNQDVNQGVYAYPFSSSGFGTRFANPTTTTGISNACCFNSADNVVFSDSQMTGTLSAWSWNSGFGTKYADPITAPNGVPKAMVTTPF